MSWFATKAFSFHLPGSSWEEKTVQVHTANDDPRSTFVITRQPAAEGVDLEASVRAIKGGYYREREIVRSERVAVGPLDGHDVALIARSNESADYHRLVCLRYGDLDLTFQWVGPAAARAEVDARVERCLEATRFRLR